MRHAPPFSVLCRGRGWLALQAALMALAVAVLAGWLAQHQGASVTVTGSLTAGLAITVALVAWHSLRHPPVQLQWDGGQWLADGQPVGMALMLDLGSALLLRWKPTAGGSSAWTGVSAREAGASWHALRTALYAQPPRPSWR